MSADRTRLCATLLEVRLAPAYGDLDPTFGVGGRTEVAGSTAFAVVAQPDGGVIVAVDGGLVRLLPTGAPDPAFGAGGLAPFPALPDPNATTPDPGFDPVPSAVGVQSDGSIVVGGRWSIRGGGTGADFAAVRYRPDGTRDLAFGGPGGGGFGVIPSPAEDFVDDLAVGPDGRVVLVGHTRLRTDPVDPRTAAAVARLTPDGAADPTFYGGQLRAVDLGAQVHDAEAAVRPSDGAVVLAVGTSDTVRVARVRADGAGTDTAFGAASYTDPATGRTESYTVALAASPPVFLQFSESVSVGGVGLQPSGDVVVGVTRAGFSGRGSSAIPFSSGVLVRIRGADGAVDAGFGADGSVDTGTLEGVVVEPTGHVVTVGTVYERASFTTLVPAGVRVARVDPHGGSVASRVIDFGGSESGRAAGFDVAARLVVAGGVARTVAGGEARTAGVARLLWPDAPPVASALAVGGPADGAVRVLSPAGGGLTAADPVPLFAGAGVSARTAAADVTGDGVPDVVGGAGPGGGPRVVVRDGRTGSAVADFFAFEPAFAGGVFVAAGYVDGDGRAEVIVTPDRGGGPVVAVFSGAGLAAGRNDAAQLARFYGIEDPSFRGGARPALGDVSGDGKADLIVAAGFLGGPRVAVFDGDALLAPAGSGQLPPKLVPDFYAFEPGVRNGAFASAGDVTGDGNADLAFGGGPGGGPRVRVFDGAALLAAGPFGTLDEAGPAEVANFFAGDAALRGGVRVALRDADGDGRADLVTGSGEGEPSRVRVYRAGNLLGGADPVPDQELDPFGAVPPGGVFVG